MLNKLRTEVIDQNTGEEHERKPPDPKPIESASSLKLPRSGAWMDVRVTGAQQMAVTFTTSEIASKQRIRIRVTGGRGVAARRLPAQITGMVEGIVGGAVLVYVRLAPSRASDARRFGSGRWLLRLGSDGSPLVWERLRAPSVRDQF